MAVKRRAPSNSEKEIIRARQADKDGVERCACGCGRALDEAVKVDFDHIEDLWLWDEREALAANDIDNFRALVHDPCHKEKTKKQATVRAHVKRMGEKHRGEQKPKKKIPSRGFQGWRNLKGEVVWKDKK